MKILVAEDEKTLNSIITKRLRIENIIVDTCYNGDDALDYISTSGYDAVILDIMMPGTDGLSVVKKLRADGNRVPVLFLTAKDALEDKVDGLNAGGDDYLVKPFELDELIARIHALIRRSSNNAKNELEIGPLTIDILGRRVHRGDTEILLTTKEFDLLYYLASNADIVLSRQQILDHVWEYDYESYSNLIDVYIKDLRKKLDIGDGTKLIRTVRGVGYVFKTQE